MLDDEDDDDVGGDVGAGVSVVIFSVGDGGVHSVGGAIIVAAVVVAAAVMSSLLFSFFVFIVVIVIFVVFVFIIVIFIFVVFVSRFSFSLLSRCQQRFAPLTFELVASPPL